MNQMVGAGAQVTRSGPGAALGWEAGAGATGVRGDPGAAPSQVVGARAAGCLGRNACTRGYPVLKVPTVATHDSEAAVQHG
jgi:hypothetical protein